MEEEYTLFIPEDIKPKKDLYGNVSKEDFIKAIWLMICGGVPLGLSYLITGSDFATIIAIISWVFASYKGYDKFLYEGRRSVFGQMRVMLTWNRCQRDFSYHYKEEWRL